MADLIPPDQFFGAPAAIPAAPQAGASPASEPGTISFLPPGPVPAGAGPMADVNPALFAADNAAIAARNQQHSPPTKDESAALVPPDQFFGAAAPPPTPEASPEQSHTFTALGPLNAPANALQGFTEQAGRAATLGLQDKVGAAAAAVKPAISAVNNSIGREWLAANPDVHAAPDNSAPQPSVSDAYHTELTNERGMGQAYAANHPVASKAATTIGTLATIPLTGTTAPGVAPAAVSTLGGKMLQGAGQGAAIGGLAGFGGSNDQSLGQTAVDTAIGAGTGGVVGGLMPGVVEKGVQPLVDMVARKFGSGAVDNQAVRQIAQRMQQDQTGGGPSAQDVLDLVNAGATTGKPLTIADLGGQGVKGLGERIANQPGPGQQVISQALTARDAGAGPRLSGDIENGLGTGSAFDTTQALIDARAAAAKPAYEAAGIPSDPAQYGQAPSVDNPLVTRLLQKSKDVQSAIARAKGHPDYADLPDNSMVLLDKAYKNIGGDANAAKISGNGEQARDLNSLRVQLRDAITGGDPNHPYQKALDAYSGPSQSLDAVRFGQGALNGSPEENAAAFAKLAPSDQEFARLGLASALKEKIAKTGMGGDEAKRVIGSDYAKSQIRPFFPDDASYDRFINSATAENTMFNTKYETLGNSRTLRRAAEAANGGEGGAAGHLVRAGAAAMEGAPVAATLSGIRGLMGMLKSGGNPKVDLSTAQSLFSTDPAANRALLARIIAGQNAPSVVPSMAVPLASLGAQGAKGLLHGYLGR